MACVRRSPRRMCINSWTSAACRDSALHSAADGGSITIDVKRPATCGLPSRSDWRTSTGRGESRLDGPSFSASEDHSFGAAFEPLHTDRPLSNQQKRNQLRTATVPRVPIVPRVPRALFWTRFRVLNRWNRSSRTSTLGTLWNVWNHWNFGSERSEDRGEQHDDDREMKDEMARRRCRATKERRESRPRRAGWRTSERAVRVPLPSFFPCAVDECRQPLQLVRRQAIRSRPAPRPPAPPTHRKTF